jgi:hypothetical protein
VIFAQAAAAFGGVKKGLKIRIDKQLAAPDRFGGINPHQTAAAINGGLAEARQIKNESETPKRQKSRCAIHDAVQ